MNEIIAYRNEKLQVESTILQCDFCIKYLRAFWNLKVEAVEKLEKSNYYMEIKYAFGNNAKWVKTDAKLLAIPVPTLQNSLVESWWFHIPLNELCLLR